MTLDFQKLCLPCTIRYFRNELHEGEIRQTSLKMERSFRLPLFFFLHAFDIPSLPVPQNFIFSFTRPFELQTDTQIQPNITEQTQSRITTQESAHTRPSYQRGVPLHVNLHQTHRLATLGLVLSILGLILLATDIYLITLVIESTAFFIAIISNRIEIHSWRQRLTIALVIIYWIVVIFMFIVLFNKELQAGFISI